MTLVTERQSDITRVCVTRLYERQNGDVFNRAIFYTLFRQINVYKFKQSKLIVYLPNCERDSVRLFARSELTPKPLLVLINFPTEICRSTSFFFLKLLFLVFLYHLS